jgi:hypothetical protein
MCISCIESLRSILLLIVDVACADGDDVLLGITKQESLFVAYFASIRISISFSNTTDSIPSIELIIDVLPYRRKRRRRGC